MEVRDAVEADAPAMARLAAQPTDVMRNLVHDRTVRVAVDADEEVGADPESETLLGVVSYDARETVVHITQLAGDPDVVAELLAEPVRFGRRENMTVEALVEADEDDRREAVERMGFQRAGSGPLFDGRPTIRYHLDPESADE